MKKRIIIGGRGDLSSLFRDTCKSSSCYDKEYDWWDYYNHDSSMDDLPFTYDDDYDYEDGYGSVFPINTKKKKKKKKSTKKYDDDYLKKYDDDYCYITFYDDYTDINIDLSNALDNGETFYSLKDFDSFCEENGFDVPYFASTMLLSNYEVYCTLNPRLSMLGELELICMPSKELLYKECCKLINEEDGD